MSDFTVVNVENLAEKKFIFWKTVKDKNGDDVEVIEKEEIWTLDRLARKKEQSQSDVTNAQAKITALDEKIAIFNQEEDGE